MKWDVSAQKCLVLVCQKYLSNYKNIFIPTRRFKQVEKNTEDWIKDFKDVN